MKLRTWWSTSVIPPVKKAVATFLFASLGIMVGNAAFDFSDETWKYAVSLGLGALLNLVYRWAEANRG